MYVTKEGMQKGWMDGCGLQVGKGRPPRRRAASLPLGPLDASQSEMQRIRPPLRRRRRFGFENRRRESTDKTHPHHHARRPCRPIDSLPSRAPTHIAFLSLLPSSSGLCLVLLAQLPSALPPLPVRFALPALCFFLLFSVVKFISALGWRLLEIPAAWLAVLRLCSCGGGVVAINLQITDLESGKRRRSSLASRPAPEDRQSSEPRYVCMYKHTFPSLYVQKE